MQINHLNYIKIFTSYLNNNWFFSILIYWELLTIITIIIIINIIFYIKNAKHINHLIFWYYIWDYI